MGTESIVYWLPGDRSGRAPETGGPWYFIKAPTFSFTGMEAAAATAAAVAGVAGSRSSFPFNLTSGIATEVKTQPLTTSCFRLLVVF